jgi:hypothetical protein
LASPVPDFSGRKRLTPKDLLIIQIVCQVLSSVQILRQAFSGVLTSYQELYNMDIEMAKTDKNIYIDL